MALSLFLWTAAKLQFRHTPPDGARARKAAPGNFFRKLDRKGKNNFNKS